MKAATSLLVSRAKCIRKQVLGQSAAPAECHRRARIRTRDECRRPILAHALVIGALCPIGHLRSSSQAIWMASRIFSLERFGSSSKPGKPCTHFPRSVKRRLTTSASGCLSSSAIAISRTSVQRTRIHLYPYDCFWPVSRRTRGSAVDHHVAGRRREGDGEAVQRLGHADLAAEPRGVGEPEREVEHVLFLLFRLVELVIPIRVDHHVTSRAGEG